MIVYVDISEYDKTMFSVSHKMMGQDLLNHNFPVDILDDEEQVEQ